MDGQRLRLFTRFGWGRQGDYLQSPLLLALEQTQAAVLTRKQESIGLIFG